MLWRLGGAGTCGGGGGGGLGETIGLVPGIGGTLLVRLSLGAVCGALSSLPKYDALLLWADCGGVASWRPGTGGGPVLMDSGVSAVGVCADLWCIDISSSDSDPGPGERGVAATGGGGGGTGRDSGGGGPEGGRVVGRSPGTGGAPMDSGRSANTLVNRSDFGHPICFRCKWLLCSR